MPALEDVILRTGDPITENWYLTLYEILKDMRADIDRALMLTSVIDYYGYVYTTLKPAEDAKFSLGTKDLRWYEVNAVKVNADDCVNTTIVNASIGNFSDAVLVQGRPVLKDGDPVSIYDVSDTVVEKLYNKCIATFTPSALLQLGSTIWGALETFDCRRVIKKHVLPFYDIFDEDIDIANIGAWWLAATGKYPTEITVQVVPEDDVIIYIKKTDKETNQTWFGALNKAQPVPRLALHKETIRVHWNDKVNVKVNKECDITVEVYIH